MDAYVQKLNDVLLCGIKTIYWQDFLRAFQEGTSDTDARSALQRLREKVETEASGITPTKVDATVAIVGQLERLLDADA